MEQSHVRGVVDDPVVNEQTSSELEHLAAGLADMTAVVVLRLQVCRELVEALKHLLASLAGVVSSHPTALGIDSGAQRQAVTAAVDPDAVAVVVARSPRVVHEQLVEVEEVLVVKVPAALLALHGSTLLEFTEKV